MKHYFLLIIITVFCYFALWSSTKRRVIWRKYQISIWYSPSYDTASRILNGNTFTPDRITSFRCSSYMVLVLTDTDEARHQGIYSTYCQHWFRLWLGAVRQQAITWANVDQCLCRHMASLGANELTYGTNCFSKKIQHLFFRSWWGVFFQIWNYLGLSINYAPFLLNNAGTVVPHLPGSSSHPGTKRNEQDSLAEQWDHGWSAQGAEGPSTRGQRSQGPIPGFDHYWAVSTWNFSKYKGEKISVQLILMQYTANEYSWPFKCE